MADTAKYVTELKSILGVHRTRKKMVFAYGFMFAFVACTVFLIFNPNDSSSSPWLNTIFTSSNLNSDTYKSHFSSIYSYFFPDDQTSVFVENSNSNSITYNSTSSNNVTDDRTPAIVNNSSSDNATGAFNAMHQAPKEKEKQEIGVSNSSVGETNTGGVDDRNKVKRMASSSLENCDIFDGRWVRDESYPLYPEGSCSIDEQYNCFLNGRPDRDYQKLRWQPNGCNIPRLNAMDMLERLRGKRLVFVGDSLNRNMWESLICILMNKVKDKSRVFEVSGRHDFKSRGFFSFMFKDYNCSVEFFWSPFLVQEWEVPESNGTTMKETLRLDLIDRSSPNYKNADIIVFNTGHWWTHEKTSKGKDYYQEGSHVYSKLNVVEAFRRALTTWARWVDANVNPNKTIVFFRGYSASHFSGGQWNSGGQCDNETEPIKNDSYLEPYPEKMVVFESVLKGMKMAVNYMNITRMTDYRKDGHPSIYRKQNMTEEERRATEKIQDCSHWCLPGVPDAWNHLLYAHLVIKLHQH